MAETYNNVNLELIKWQKKVSWTFLRASRFDAYTGSGPGNIIQRVMDLAGDGKQVNVPLMDQLRSDGVATGQLVGHEEQLDNYGYPMWCDWLRHAVSFKKSSVKESAINIREQGTPALQSFIKRWRRDDMVDALLAIPSATQPSNFHTDPGNRVNGIRWQVATAAQRNSWQTANNDRIVFGSKLSNTTVGNVSTSLSTMVAATDKMTAALGRLLKRQVQQTTVMAAWPAIRPYSLKGDEEWLVCFLGTRAMRDLSVDPEMANANLYARNREAGDPLEENPIFTGAGFLKDGIIYREIPEIDGRYIIGSGTNSAPNGPLAGVGGASADVSPIFMCGQSAYAYVVGQMPKSTNRDETDYQFLKGIGVEAQYGYGKVAKAPPDQAGTIGNLKDWGVATGFVISLPDA
jgi:hypothetical protein